MSSLCILKGKKSEIDFNLYTYFFRYDRVVRALTVTRNQLGFQLLPREEYEIPSHGLDERGFVRRLKALTPASVVHIKLRLLKKEYVMQLK